MVMHAYMIMDDPHNNSAVRKGGLWGTDSGTECDRGL